MSSTFLQKLAGRGAFADVAWTPAGHFKLYFYAAVLRVVHRCVEAFGSREKAFAQFPFLAGYDAELNAHGMNGLSCDEATRAWLEGLRAWEASADAHLPLCALREDAGLGHEALTLLLCTGLGEEDARFGLLFAAMQDNPAQRRPTTGLLDAWWRAENEEDEARACLRRLREFGLLVTLEADAPRAERAWLVPEPLWEILRGEVHAALAPWLGYRSPAELLKLDALVVPDETRRQLEALPSLVTSGEVRALVVRGPRHNGRRTALGALARSLGCGLLEASGLNAAGDERWRLLGSLATALRALPVVVFDLAPGETLELPQLRGCAYPLCVVLGTQGGVSGRGAECAVALTLEMPGRDARRELWRRGLNGLGAVAEDVLARMSEHFRITSGNIRRAAGLAQAYAALAGRDSVTHDDAQQASRALNRHVLDALAVRLETSGDWSRLAADEETMCELRELESRCRHREHLKEMAGGSPGAQMTAGVRALFTGPSGTGKTLAARLLAAMLHMDIYRLDLSLVVNKYIGETEKNLNQVFARAEELDVILLLDEGDALLTQRTSVQTANDRYANLETNYLLQRLESYDGILVVTTNASDRIDGAFQRRMDVVVDFRPPDAAQRWAIWHLHLPCGHSIDHDLLDEVAERCALSGGQIRNAALHAALLALTNGGVVNASHLNAGLQREYRKAGGVCPLRG